MLVSKRFYNCKCNCCGRLLSETYYEELEDFEIELEDSNWIYIDRKHYCPDCYSYDDNDNIITKDMLYGRRYSSILEES